MQRGRIAQTTAKNGYKFSALVTAIVQSDPFRMRRGDASSATPAPKSSPKKKTNSAKKRLASTR
jgi:hypothetical protein